MLEAANVHKFYSSGTKKIHVLKGIDVVIREGDFIAILGPSGAGKSTLLHILGGLDAPSRGTVLFEKGQLYELSDAQLSRVRNERIGFVFQFYHLLGEFSVLENVMMTALVGAGVKLTRRELKARAKGLLEAVGLEERGGHFPSQLSGGEQQRVAIARALINRPKLLLCDEPTGNLDSQNGLAVISLLKKINREDKATLVLVTHNLELARQADKVYSLKDGVLVN
jgi:ABC-type lipoprotein export system ATPase subunit